MSYKKLLQYFSLFICVILIATCFMPWVHIVPINTTLNGFNAKPFANGTDYGRAGIWISIFCVINFILTLLPFVAAKRANMFVASLLLAYTISKYTIFSSSIEVGDVIKFAGIYLIVLLSFVLVICSVFPYLKEEEIK